MSLIVCINTVVIEIQHMCYYMGVGTDAVLFVCFDVKDSHCIECIVIVVICGNVFRVYVYLR